MQDARTAGARLAPAGIGVQIGDQHLQPVVGLHEFADRPAELGLARRASNRRDDGRAFLQQPGNAEACDVA